MWVKVVKLGGGDGLVTVDDHVNEILCQMRRNTTSHHENLRVLGVFRIF